jgi:hypothetical protein
MSRALHLLCGLALSGFFSSTSAQTRTWAFSKDTVYEGQSGTDTMTVNGQRYFFPYTNKVAVVNQGASPLTFDSLYIEKVQAFFDNMTFGFVLYDSTKNGQLSPSYAGRSAYWGGAYCPSTTSCSFTPISGFGSIEVQASRNLYDFEIDAPVPLAKKAVTAAAGDTICFRMIFTAKNSRGRDTLIVRGTQQYPSLSVILQGLRDSKDSKIKRDIFDLRGRRMEKMPEGAKAPVTPLVSPKD